MSVGNNILNLYSNHIFALSGVEPKVSSFITALTNIIGCFISVYLSKRFGRKILLIVGFGLLCCLHALIIFSNTFNFTLVLTAAVASFSLVFNSFLPACFVYLSDIGTEAALALSTAAVSVCILINSFTTPYMLMNPSIGVSGTFAILGVITAIGLFFSIFVIKETKGLTDDQCKSLYAAKKK